MAAKIVGGDGFLLLLLLVVVGASLLEMASPANTGKCNGSMAECGLLGEEEEEFMMDSDIHRRFLQGNSSRHIVYGALNGANTLCNGLRGQSYANCVGPAKSASLYHRGCFKSNGCKGGQ